MSRGIEGVTVVAKVLEVIGEGCIVQIDEDRVRVFAYVPKDVRVGELLVVKYFKKVKVGDKTVYKFPFVLQRLEEKVMYNKSSVQNWNEEGMKGLFIDMKG